MISSTAGRTFGMLFAGLVLASFAMAAFAGARFIANGKVVRRGDGAELTLQFSCTVHYVSHQPEQRGNMLRIQLERSSICPGSAPVAMQSRENFLPADAAEAHLIDVEYDGGEQPAALLTLSFRQDVSFTVQSGNTPDTLLVQITPTSQPVGDVRGASGGASLVHRPAGPEQRYVINLASSREPLAAGGDITIKGEPRPVSVSDFRLGDETWYRLRVGFFTSAEEARDALPEVRREYPGAWIDRAGNAEAAGAIGDAAGQPTPSAVPDAHTASVAAGPSEVDALMQEARGEMLAGNFSRAVQIYTKVLRLSGHSRAPEAQEYMALAREKNGQIAHAKAEYERYLAMFPDEEGAARVRQRLASILATGRKADPTVARVPAARAGAESPWRVFTYFSQYYRRDANQLGEQNEIVSQSALYSDVNVDVRRRGERFDLSSRLTVGYRNDFLGEEDSSDGDGTRVSYAYADLLDTVSGLGGRIGRQSRNTGGVLGRFDGLDLGYRATERVRLGTVFGKPVSSAGDGIDLSRSFYSVNVEYAQVMDIVDLGAFYIRQHNEGMVDREAVGGELRYFSENASLWGLVDYDTSYQELGSAWLQGSWRFASRLSVHAMLDRRHSPWLAASNALIGQPVGTFEELIVLISEDEIRQLGLDRSPVSQTFSLGLSYPLSPRLQFNADASRTAVDSMPETGGVPAFPETTYAYYSASLTASSLLKEGDVSIIGMRWSTSDTARVASLNLDTRFPVGGSLRINPRLRVDRREILSDGSTEWQFTPGMRLQWLWSRRLRFELEAGRQMAERDSDVLSADRESYFVNLGYQAFFQ